MIEQTFLQVPTAHGTQHVALDDIECISIECRVQAVMIWSGVLPHKRHDVIFPLQENEVFLDYYKEILQKIEPKDQQPWTWKVIKISCGNRLFAVNLPHIKALIYIPVYALMSVGTTSNLARIDKTLFEEGKIAQMFQSIINDFRACAEVTRLGFFCLDMGDIGTFLIGKRDCVVVIVKEEERRIRFVTTLIPPGVPNTIHCPNLPLETFRKIFESIGQIPSWDVACVADTQEPCSVLYYLNTVHKNTPTIKNLVHKMNLSKSKLY